MPGYMMFEWNISIALMDLNNGASIWLEFLET
jgi:hypothetical protein